ncbi:MAG: molybdopterin-dependent oxidoreductase, partial [Chloroflexi bacterium]|nr:molybdopterin-dependent oxidoreductase [Chloroflexota bacterium]
MTSTPVPPVAPVSPPNFTRYVKQRSPEKSELPLQAVVSVCTPIELFYVRNHFPEVPVVDPAAYRLTIHGLVEHPVSLALAELRSLPRRELIATMECAG